MRSLDPDVLADQVLRLDGPYQLDDIVAAAGLAAELVRRLNHATFRAADVYTVDGLTGRMVGLMSGLPQLFGQLVRHAGDLAADPMLASDDGRDASPVVSGAEDALECVQAHVADAAQALKRAHTFTARLYIRDSDS